MPPPHYDFLIKVREFKTTWSNVLIIAVAFANWRLWYAYLLFSSRRGSLVLL